MENQPTNNMAQNDRKNKIITFASWLLNFTYNAVNKNRITIILLALTGCYLLFYQGFFSLVIAPLLSAFFDKMKPSALADILFGMAALIGGLYFIKKLHGKKIALNDFVIIFIILTIYLPHRLHLINQSWYYLRFKYINLLNYGDVVVALLLIAFFNPSCRFRRISDAEPTLVEDNIYNIVGTDLFKRTEYAKRIATLLIKNQFQQSFALAITGSWGSGKTVFLRQMISELNSSFVVVEFNPWLSKASENVLDDFFAVASERIEPYSKSLSTKLKRYAQTLFSIEETVGVKFSRFFSIQQGATPYSSLEKQRCEIAKSLHADKIYLAIVVDDLDRLNGDEVLRVFSLIRNTFNFPNVIFLVAFDYQYVFELLHKKDIPNPDIYLEKIFQLDVDLPTFPSSILIPQLARLVLKEKDQMQLDEITNSISLIDSEIGLKNYFTNLRECIRFANSFNLVYKNKHSQVNITDFLILELLKMKDKNTYLNLRSALSSGDDLPYLSFPMSGITDNINIEFKIDTFATEKDKGNLSGKLLHSLFNRHLQIDDGKGIRVPGNAIRYFSDHLFGTISFSDFDVYKQENGLKPFTNFLLEHTSRHKTTQITDLIGRVQHFQNSTALFNFCKGVMIFCNSINNFSLVSVCQALCGTNLTRKLFPNDKEYCEFIYKLLQPSVFPYQSESFFGGEILSGFYGGYHFANNIVDKEKIKNILLDNLSQFVSSANTFDARSLTIHHKIIDHVEEGTRFIIIDKKADEIVKAYILKYPMQFLRSNLIVPNREKYALEAFLDQYLTWPVFEEILELAENDLEILRLKNFYLQFKQNNYKPIFYNLNSIKIVSSPSTHFIGSPDFPNLIRGNSEIRTGKVYDKQFKILDGAVWIAHSRNISFDEQECGGTYLFVKEFDLTGLQNQISSAKIYFLVDDFLSLEIEGEKTEELGGHIELNQIDLTRYIINGRNKLLFKIRNIPFEREKLTWNFEKNPYEFIYAIVIDLKSDNANTINVTNNDSGASFITVTKNRPQNY